MSMVTRVVLILAALMLVTTSGFAQTNWPQFRGSDSTGVAEDANLPERWGPKRNVDWKTKIPGRGWSSPIVWGDRIFLTTAVKESGKTEKVKKGLYFRGERPTPTEHHRWMLYCLDRTSGDVIWKKQVHSGVPQHGHHLKNTLATETPVTDGRHVYAYFGNVGLFCYDFAGNFVWKKYFDSVPTRANWGTAASPVLHGDRIYIVNDNQQKSFLIALNKKTGDKIWRIERKEESNWATPYIWENEVRTEIITPGTNRVRSYDLEGNPLWEFGGMSKITIPTPFSKFNLLYVASGYVLDQRKPIFAVRPGASGDISLKKSQTSNESIAWSQKMAGPYNPSPIVYGDYFYVLYDRGLFACFDAKTGSVVYKKRRIGSGARNFTASPWAYNGKIFCLNEHGVTFVIQAGSKYKLLGKNKLNELSMATPAISGESLFIRTASHLYRISKSAASAGK